MLPRQDERKQQLALQMRQALRSSRNYQEFEQAMKDKGYQVIRGRGISFVDDKKVKIKGSEVNYSLRTIERILAQQKTLVPNSFINPFQKSETFNPDYHSSNNVSKELSRLVDVLLKPGQTNGAPDDAGSQQKFKKKPKRSHHF